MIIISSRNLLTPNSNFVDRPYGNEDDKTATTSTAVERLDRYKRQQIRPRTSHSKRRKGMGQQWLISYALQWWVAYLCEYMCMYMSVWVCICLVRRFSNAALHSLLYFHPLPVRCNNLFMILIKCTTIMMPEPILYLFGRNLVKRLIRSCSFAYPF
jgi:hypothetical protein